MSCIAYFLNNKSIGLCSFLFCFFLNATPVFIFEGNVQYSDGDLLGIIKEQREKFFENQDPSHVDDAAYRILAEYRNNGYTFARVRYRINKDRITFYIVEHKAIIINEVKIVAENGKALSYNKERLRKFVNSAPMLGRHFLVKNKVAQDVTAINSFYLSEGYLQVECRADFDFSPAHPDSTEVNISIVIKEGFRSYLDKLYFSGNKSFDSKLLENFIVENLADKIYRPRMHGKLAIRLRDYYREHGYAQVKIKTRVKDVMVEDKEMLSITFEIQEGERNRIRSIKVKGNDLTQESFIRSQITIREHQWFDLIEIRRSENQLHETELFVAVEINEKIVSPKLLDLVIVVQERDSKNLNLMLGYSTTYGVVAGIDFEHNNIFGIGRKFHASVESTLFSGELSKTEISLALIEPWLLDSRNWSARVSAFALLEETPSYEVFDRGGDFSFRKEITKEITASFGYAMIWSEILDVEEGINDAEEGTTFLSLLRQKMVFNFRNDPSYPTSGSYHYIEMEQSLTALASDIDYWKVYWHSAWYFAIIERVVLAVSLRGGIISPFAGTDSVSIQRRFFSGGATTVRSFKEKELPPLDENDNAVGGEGLFLASTELRIPVYGSAGLSGFIDAGQIMPQVRSINQYRVSKLKYAVGFSVWYNTIVGPIRFDMGFNPERGENSLTGKKDPSFAWFISIGFSY